MLKVELCVYACFATFGNDTTVRALIDEMESDDSTIG